MAPANAGSQALTPCAIRGSTDPPAVWRGNRSMVILLALPSPIDCCVTGALIGKEKQPLEIGYEQTFGQQAPL